MKIILSLLSKNSSTIVSKPYTPSFTDKVPISTPLTPSHFSNKGNTQFFTLPFTETMQKMFGHSQPLMTLPLHQQAKKFVAEPKINNINPSASYTTSKAYRQSLQALLNNSPASVKRIQALPNAKAIVPSQQRAYLWQNARDKQNIDKLKQTLNELFSGRYTFSLGLWGAALLVALLYKTYEAIAAEISEKEKNAETNPTVGCLLLERPSHYEYAVLSEHCYKTEFKEGDAVHLGQHHLPGWHIEKVYEDPVVSSWFGFGSSTDSAYRCVVYVHHERKQIVLAYRGTVTDAIWEACATAHADAEGIIQSKLTKQSQLCHITTLEMVEKAKKLGYRWSTTGHSLGAWLAELSVYDCHADSRIAYPHASAVTFDSPGSVEMMEHLQPNLLLSPAKVKLKTLDVTTYLSHPNVVNTCHPHVGVSYRVYPKLSEKITTHGQGGINFAHRDYVLESHSMAGILATFNPETGLPREMSMIRDWPVTYWNVSFQRYGKTSLVSSLTSIVYQYASGNVDTSQYQGLLALLELKDIFDAKQSYLIDGESVYQQLKEKSSQLTEEQRVILEFGTHYRLQPYDPKEMRLCNIEPEIARFLCKYDPREAPLIANDATLTILQEYVISQDKNTLYLKKEVSYTALQFREQLYKLLNRYPNLLDRLLPLKIISRHIPALDPLFLGREEHLAIIQQNLAHTGIAVKTQVVGGMGGLGKSQLAVGYLERHQHEYDVIWWFNADDETSIKVEFLNLAKALKIITEFEINSLRTASDMKDCLQRLSHELLKHRTLLVFDNAQIADHIKALPAHCHVLVTTRNTSLHAWPPEMPLLLLEPLKDEDAIDLLCHYIKREGKKTLEQQPGTAEFLQAARTLTGLLGNHPYMLAQAGNYIRESIATDIQGYITLFKRKRHILFRDQAPKPEDNIAVVIQLSIQRLTDTKKQGVEEDSSKRLLAVKILQYCAYLHGNAIPTILIYLLIGQLMPEIKQDASELELLLNYCLNILRQQSLININAVEKTLTIHALTQTVLQDMIGQKSLQLEIVETLINTCNAFYLETNTKYYLSDARSLLPHLQTLLKHVDSSPTLTSSETVTALIHNLGITHYSLGDALKAKEYLERALLIEEKTYGKDHPQVAPILNNLGNAYGDLGDAAKKKELLERVLVIRGKAYGEDDPQVASTLADLGNAYADLGDWAKAKEYLERALKIQEKAYGKDDPQVAFTLVDLGNAYGALGDAVKKKAYLKRALVIEEKVYEKDSPYIATTLTNLGDVYRVLGKVTKARKILERALSIKEKAYGKDHVETSMTLTNLGIVYRVLGEATKAKEIFERALKIQEAAYGEDHPHVAITLVSLGIAYRVLREATKAKEILERALKIQETAYGEDHLKVASTLTNLGSAHGDLGDWAKAKALFERVLKIQEKAYGKDHTEVAISLINLGSAHAALGDIQHAISFLERAYNIYKLAPGYGNEHNSTKFVQRRLGIYKERLAQKSNSNNSTTTNSQESSFFKSTPNSQQSEDHQKHHSEAQPREKQP
jgi:tetratricopeptide (TPR) repeat protein